MAERIVIDPVTRIEGHAKITIQLDDSGNVTDARFHVTEFRGFERFCEGRPFWEMAGITARICGICPVSHLLASAGTREELVLTFLALLEMVRTGRIHLVQTEAFGEIRVRVA